MSSRFHTARRWTRLGLRKGLVHPLCRQLYRDTDRDIGRTVLIAGTARSGTTWLAELLSARLPCRIMFEPFNPRQVPAYAAFNYFQYMRPERHDAVLEEYCRSVFTGRIRDPWVDRQVDRLRPKRRIIKEIRANLFLRWIRDRFPRMPILFLVRHPCAVVASRMQLGWDTDADIEPLLSQPELVSDFLRDKLDFIRGCRTPEEKHAVIWSISNLVPMRQFGHGSLPVVFYEELLSRPEQELPRVFRLAGLDYDEATLERITRPSATTVNFREVAAGGQDLARWKRSLTSGQVARVRAVVEEFGLGDLYGDSPMPASGRLHRS